jgi:hypothetical protein
MTRISVATAGLAALTACAGDATLTRDALMDPAECESCHPAEFEEWTGSMHAYSSDDPVFLAINRIGQQQTGGALGGLCVRCHAPMALAEGATADGLNLGELPRRLRGVTCYYCHQIDAVLDDHNGAFTLADDTVMRGSVADPIDAKAHGSGYSPLYDSSRPESSTLCGACHDVVTPAGVHLERTFAEWRASVFATAGPAQLTCGGCHMPGRTGVGAEVPDAPQRRLYDHAMPGIDVALTPWPGTDVQRAGIERDLRASIKSDLCVDPPGTTAEVVLDNLLVGHAFPSGVTHARRAWVELVAYAGGERIFASGVIAPGEPVATRDDPSLWLLRSRLYDANDNEVHAVWEAARVDSELLPPAVTNDPTDPAYYHAVRRGYSLPTSADRVELRLWIRPLGLELLDELIAVGALAPEVRAAVPTFELAAAAQTWTLERGYGCASALPRPGAP